MEVLFFYSFSSHLPELEVVCEVAGYGDGKFRGCCFMSVTDKAIIGITCQDRQNHWTTSIKKERRIIQLQKYRQQWIT